MTRHNQHWTNEEDKKLMKHYANKSYEELMDMLGRSKSSILMRFNILGLSRVEARESFDYVVYKGEEILMIGTIKEIAAALGNTESTVKYYTTPSHHKRISERNSQNAIIIVRAEGEI